MPKTLKKLLKLLEFPEAKALWTWFTKPLHESVALVDNASQYQALVFQLLEENKCLISALATYRHGRKNGIVWKFECHQCKEHTVETAPPVLRFIKGEGKQLCTLCSELIPEPSSERQFRPSRLDSFNRYFEANPA